MGLLVDRVLYDQNGSETSPGVVPFPLYHFLVRKFVVYFLVSLFFRSFFNVFCAFIQSSVYLFNQFIHLSVCLFSY